MSTTTTLLDNGLPAINRVITTHNPAAEAIFDTSIPDPIKWQQLAEGARFGLAYTSNTIPVDLSSDLPAYQASLTTNPPGVMIPGGTVLRYVDMPPNALSPMHRTVSLDYGVVLEGEVWLVLDSGEEKLLRRGDVAVQRGTNHAWRNGSSTEWARMLYVLQEAEEVKVGEKVLGEDYGGGISELPASKRH